MATYIQIHIYIYMHLYRYTEASRLSKLHVYPYVPACVNMSVYAFTITKLSIHNYLYNKILKKSDYGQFLSPGSPLDNVAWPSKDQLAFGLEGCSDTRSFSIHL